MRSGSVKISINEGGLMGRLLYPNFLSNPEEYAKAEAAWAEAWRDLMRHSRLAALWRSPWLSTTFADGSPCRDGNPIFSAFAPDRALGVRVVQLPPDDGAEELTYWTDYFAAGQPEAVKELVIACVLSDETVFDAIGLMHQWVTHEELAPRADVPPVAHGHLLPVGGGRSSGASPRRPWEYRSSRVLGAGVRSGTRRPAADGYALSPLAMPRR